MKNIRLYSIVEFMEHGHCGNKVKGVVTSITDKTLIIEDYSDQVWIMDEKNVKLSSLQFGDR